nr:defective chorion-1 protein, FC106 isoform isoform X2 [Drosophila kikkawai]
MRPHSQLLILALLGIQVAAQSSCDPASLGQATATKAGEDATATAAATAAVATAEDGGTSTAAGDGFQDSKILSQTPPIRAFSRGNPTVDALYMMFPALGSLIHWGSLFPAYSFLGAPAPGSEAAASKVVLVLADDATAKTRVTRQNDPASQPNPFSFLTDIQNLQGLPNVANFDPNTLGQSLMNPQTAFTALQGLPGLSGLQGLQGMLGAAGPVSTPAAAPAGDATATASSSAPAAEAAAAPAAVPVPVLGQTPWNLQNFDANNMLGQTMNLLSQMPQMPPVQAPANLPNFNFLGQMFPTPAASDISEVRVRPEVAYAPEAQVAQLKIKTALEKETEKVQQQEEQERVPLLWFRMPSNPTSEDQRTAEDLRVEAKLRAFERQVIAELKMLQKIELMAKEMRSSASASQGKDSPYKISYPLSRTPVHKITRSDIERALRDDYVRRLLQKEAQRKARISDLQRSTGGYKRQADKPGQSMSKEDIVQIMAYAYRMASEQMAEKEKQDKIYAAYRTGSEDSTKPMERQQQEQMQQQRQMVQEMQQMQQQQERQVPLQIPGAFQHRQMMQGPQMIQQNPMMIQQQQERQMMQQQQHESQMIQQQPEKQMIQQQQERQMMADPQAIQQRQMIQEPQMNQQTPTMPRQMPEIQMIQQQQQERQMMADPQAIQQMQQMQWTEEQAKIQQRQMAAVDQQMMQQRQMMVEDPQAIQQMQQMIQQNPIMQQRQMMAEDPQAIQQMQQRQWAEEQAKIQQNAMMMQQQQQQRQMMQDPSQMMQQRQMAAENPPAQSQNQQPIQWTEDPSRIQQIQQMQQRSEDQQRQMGGQATTMTMPAERQWADEKSKAIQQMSQQPELDNEESEDLILGEAGPQMPENEGTARHKVDALGLGGNQRKKSKSKSKSGGTPTVVNLYYSTPAQRPSYGPSYAPPSYAPPSYAPPSYDPRPSYAPRPSYSAPSYGTSYGGGGYGSNAYGAGGSSYQRPASPGYRAAVGNDEVDEMLRRHQTLARATHFRQ